MRDDGLLEVLEQVARGAVAPEDALARCRLAPVEDMLTGLTLDAHRAVRTGLGEVVFAQGKSDAQLRTAMARLAETGPVLATRVDARQGRLLERAFPDGCFWPEARLFTVGRPLPLDPPWPARGEALVLSAGAADRATALEAFGTMCFFGLDAGFIADVGVAGLHRLKPHLPALDAARLIVAVAGMEGALPGVVAGFVRCPVLAVPTSVGYGVGAGGRAALQTMLCSCVPGVAVLNIDNGFGAGAFAAKYLRG